MGLNAPESAGNLGAPIWRESLFCPRRALRSRPPDPRPRKSRPISPQAAASFGGIREGKFSRGDFCLFRGLAGFGGVWPPASTGKKCD